MKLVENENYRRYTRVQFDRRSTLSFEGSFEELFALYVKVFRETKITATVDLKGHCPLKRPSAAARLNVLFMELDPSRPLWKGRTKTKSLYGLTAEQAKSFLLEGLERHSPRFPGVKKLEQKTARRMVRVQFGTVSASFEDTTVEKVFDVALRVFTETDVKADVFCVKKTNMKVRAEFGKGTGHSGSKSKTLYGIAPEEALRHFLDNYKKLSL